MKLRRDVKVAWNLLHLLTDEYQMVKQLVHRYNDKYKDNVSQSYLARVVTALANYDLIITHKTTGVKKNNTNYIFLIDILRCLGVKLGGREFTPAGNLEQKLNKFITDQYIVNR